MMMGILHLSCTNYSIHKHILAVACQFVAYVNDIYYAYYVNLSQASIVCQFKLKVILTRQDIALPFLKHVVIPGLVN